VSLHALLLGCCYYFYYRDNPGALEARWSLHAVTYVSTCHVCINFQARLGDALIAASMSLVAVWLQHAHGAVASCRHCWSRWQDMSSSRRLIQKFCDLSYVHCYNHIRTRIANALTLRLLVIWPEVLDHGSPLCFQRSAKVFSGVVVRFRQHIQ
jgi:hypothetical protein